SQIQEWASRERAAMHLRRSVPTATKRVLPALLTLALVGVSSASIVLAQSQAVSNAPLPPAAAPISTSLMLAQAAPIPKRRPARRPAPSRTPVQSDTPAPIPAAVATTTEPQPAADSSAVFDAP